MVLGKVKRERQSWSFRSALKLVITLLVIIQFRPVIAAPDYQLDFFRYEPSVIRKNLSRKKIVLLFLKKLVIEETHHAINRDH